MTAFSLKNYTKLNINSLLEASKFTSIFIENLVISELIHWTETHSKNNPLNSITQLYSSDPKKASEIRLNKIIDSFKTKHFIAENCNNTPTLYRICSSEYCTTTKFENALFAERLTVKNKGKEENIFVISLEKKFQHTETI